MSFYGVTDLGTYVVGAVGIVLLPGPNSLFVLSVASARGVRAGYQGALGVFVGDSILLSLVALGAASVLHNDPLLFKALKYIGAAYLAWIGLNLLRAAWRGWHRPVAAQAMQAAPAALPVQVQQPFRRALVISLLNPKAILFLLSFFVQFIDPTYASPMVPFLILSTIIMVFSFLYLSILIFAGAHLARSLGQRKRLSAGLSGAVGGVFVWFGAKLATASLG